MAETAPRGSVLEYHNGKSKGRITTHQGGTVPSGARVIAPSRAAAGLPKRGSNGAARRAARTAGAVAASSPRVASTPAAARVAGS